MPERLFIFMQMEFPWALGPADGRYLLRAGADAEPERVVVLGTLGAPRRRSGATAACAAALAARALGRARRAPAPRPGARAGEHDARRR